MNDAGSHGSYRPLCVLTFKLNYLLGGFTPWGYHLVNIILHCIATALLVRVARIVLPQSKSSIGPAITGLIFATHPIHTEAVAGVVGRADLAACNFYLLSFLSYIAHVKCRDTICCLKHPCGWALDNNFFVKEDEKQKKQTGGRTHKLFAGLKNRVANFYWAKNTKQDVLPSESSATRTNVVEEFETSCCWKKKLKHWGSLASCILLSVAAMLSKETGITVLGICVLFDLLHFPVFSKVSDSCFRYRFLLVYS